MIQIFYSIFNDNDELLFANNTPYDTKQDAINSLKDLHKRILKKHNIKVTEYTEEKLQFIDLPETELEGKEIHTFQILKGVD